MVISAGGLTRGNTLQRKGFAEDVAADVMKNLTMKGYTVKRIYERSSKEFMPRRNAFVALNCVLYSTKENYPPLKNCFLGTISPYLFLAHNSDFSAKSDVNRRYASYNLRVKCDTE